VNQDDLDRLQTTLANYVGPIAGIIVERARSRSSSLDLLSQQVAWEIEDENDRSAFLRDMRRGKAETDGTNKEPITQILPPADGAPEGAGATFDPAFLHEIRDELMPALGEAATDVVREAALKAHNEAQFYLVLARLMPDRALRDRILARAIKRRR
jgi:serine/threonine-protein kinase